VIPVDEPRLEAPAEFETIAFGVPSLGHLEQ
jgi:hypothetical protein